MTGSASSRLSGLYDAHVHLHAPQLQTALESDKAWLASAGVNGWVTNGTHPEDWHAVAGMAGGPVMAAYGVHPWKVDSLPDDWEVHLREYLSTGAVSVGEIGLDNWIEPRNEARQKEVFLRQLQIASEMNLVPTIHCLRAWGSLVDCLRAGPALAKGFLVHGYGGSAETLRELLDLGGNVSFSAYAADPGRKRMRDAARACPADRILVETDAPDMVPPEGNCQFPLMDSEGRRIHHPGEIETAYRFLAQWRAEDLGDFVTQVGQNFQRLFG